MLTGIFKKILIEKIYLKKVFQTVLFIYILFTPPAVFMCSLLQDLSSLSGENGNYLENTFYYFLVSADSRRLLRNPLLQLVVPLATWRFSRQLGWFSESKPQTSSFLVCV
jgi:hypothetical protein